MIRRREFIALRARVSHGRSQRWRGAGADLSPRRLLSAPRDNPNCDAARHAREFKLANGPTLTPSKPISGTLNYVHRALYGFETKSIQEFLNFWKDRGSKPLDHKVIRQGNTEPDGRIKQMAAKVYALSESGTFPPFSASLTITCLCSQIFIAAELATSPV